MQWENVDFENRMITIDEEVMKGRRVHVVPMSDQIINLLNTLKPITSPVSSLCSPGGMIRKSPSAKMPYY